MQHIEALPVGTILDSETRKYTILSVLGKGGFGITYLAKSSVLVDNIPFEVEFAIKEHFISSMNERNGTTVLVSNSNNTAEVKESIDTFLVEAKRLKKLSQNHHGIVRVNENFSANGTAYYVMEYVKGKSLREYVKQSRLGKLSEAEALKLFTPVARTVAYLHENRVTHLDIKPDNILIRENDEPVLIDFGLSKHYTLYGKPTSVIKTEGCSAGYSPIEQYVGIRSFSPEADVYALGAVLYYMLTGKDPVVASDITPEYIRKQLEPVVSQGLLDKVLKAMQKDKAERAKSVDCFFSDSQQHDVIITKKLSSHHKETKTKYWKYPVVAMMAILGFFCPDFVPSGEADMSEIAVSEETDQENNEETFVPTKGEQDALITDSMAVSAKEMQQRLKDYLFKAEECCNKAEKMLGKKGAIQVLLDAKYYYYDRAMSLSIELNGKGLQPNNRLDSLVTHEFNYWVEQGNKVGKERSKYSLKKSYYENAYKLREKKDVKDRIEWLDNQLKQKSKRR